MNVDDVFLMLDAKTYQADYVSPNAEKLLGVTVEQICKDVWTLGKLNPGEADDLEKNHLEGIRFMNRGNGISNMFIRKPGKNAGFIMLQWAAR